MKDWRRHGGRPLPKPAPRASKQPVTERTDRTALRIPSMEGYGICVFQLLLSDSFRVSSDPEPTNTERMSTESKSCGDRTAKLIQDHRCPFRQLLSPVVNIVDSYRLPNLKTRIVGFLSRKTGCGNQVDSTISDIGAGRVTRRRLVA